VSSFDHGLLLQSKKPPGGLVARMARQGIAGVVLELLQYLSWREGSLAAPAIDEGLFAQLPAILGVYERGGRRDQGLLFQDGIDEQRGGEGVRYAELRFVGGAWMLLALDRLAYCVHHCGGHHH
jgi:hypothetical protein